MVRTHAVLCCALECHIGMMIRFIDLMNQRRTLLGSDTPYAVTGGAIGREFGLADLQLRGRYPTGRLRRVLIGGVRFASRQGRGKDH
jgi:hypothetical protein